MGDINNPAVTFHWSNSVLIAQPNSLWAAEGNGTVWTPYLSNFTLSGKISGGKEAQSLQNIKKKNLDVVIWETSAANRASVIINLHFFLRKYWCLLHDTHWKFQLAWQVGYSTGH